MIDTAPAPRKEAVVASVFNRLVSTQKTMQPLQPGLVTLAARRVVLARQVDDAALVYTLSDPVELQLVQTCESFYPSRRGSRNGLTDIEVIESFSERGGVWKDDAGKGLSDEQIQEALLGACAALNLSQREARMWSDAVTVALASRKGCALDPRMLP